MRTRHIRHVVANAVAVVAVMGIVFGASGCGSPDDAAPPETSDQPAVPGALNDALGQGGESADGALGSAGQAAAGIAALGGLGQDQGMAENVRNLGTQYATDGKALLDQLQASAGGDLPTQPTDEQQAALSDLSSRTGEQFDQAWLRSAQQMQQQVRDAANAVLADDSASEEAKSAAQEALNRLEALDDDLTQAAAPAGAGTPQAVDAGSGGQAAGDVTPAAVVVVGFGTLLLAGALWWRRRAA